MDNYRPTEVTEMTIETPYGTFEAKKYVATQEKYTGVIQVGASINLTFTPKISVEVADSPIGLLQTVRLKRSQITLLEQYEDEPLKLLRMTEAGTHIDQSTYVTKTGQVLSEHDAKIMWKTGADIPITQTNPIYNATNTLDSWATKLTQQTGTNEFGSIYKPNGSELARLVDSPSRILFPEEEIEHVFEVTALTLSGSSRYLGSVRWGYTATVSKDAKHADFALLPLQKLSDGNPTEEFKRAAEKWNGQPVPDYRLKEKIERVQIPLF